MADSLAPVPRTPLDPDPSEWLNTQRLQRLEADLLAARSTLAIGGVLPKVLNLWLRQQLADEAPWSAEARQAAIFAREEDWREKVKPEKFGLHEEEVAIKLAVAPGCEAWAAAQWSHRLETLFLLRKDQLDRASCRLLRVSDKGHALELYHRIKASEDSFAALAQRHGEGPESTVGGQIPLQALASMPLGLAKVLCRLEEGELLKPTRLGAQFALVQLDQWQPARFDAATRSALLSAELDLWLKSVGVLALAHLNSLDRIEEVIP